MTTLYIRHPARADSEGTLARFALVADGGALMQQGEGVLKGMGDLVASSRRVVLLLAAADVTLLHIKVPPLSAARLRTALPNLVEEQVLGDPEECVLVAAPAAAPDGLRAIAVAQRAWLEALVRSLLAMGARSVAAFPGQLCLPLAPGNASAAIDGGGITIRHGQYHGLGLALAGEPALALQTVRALAGDTPLTLYVHEQQLGEYQALLAEAGPAVTLEADHWAHWIAGSKSTVLDLVPGLGAAGARTRDWQRWKWPVRLALLAVAVNLAGLNYQWLRLKREADNTRTGMVQVFRAAYPKETVLSNNLERQMQQKIAQARGASGQVGPDEFTFQAAALGEAMRTLGKPPELASITFRERSMTVKVKPEGADPALAANLKPGLQKYKLDVSDVAANTILVRTPGAKP
ncbi:type II secretion system protein GspL [Massilia genomosp. 1]|uniref:General secretion pathway protein GspL n=1 Tax=Massilia genomosp. 1 TaxID=2609280 RepID=A0ABX0MGU0_9BURK|nr:type II secretion system protein GspL [Massilia genomosp. 1]NHZ62011.1 general secretion pathway protein GspL [Massilia genomosp. 1]